MKKIVPYVISDLLRNKIVIAYAVFLLLVSFSVFSLEDNSSKGMLSLLNVILLFVPLICIIFSAIYLYNSIEFIELLVSMPLQRKTIWLSLFAGLALSLSLAFFIGVGIPLLIFNQSATAIVMLIAGIFLSVIFVAIAMLAAVITRDKAKGIGVAILLWFYFSILFDGLVLLLLFQLADYPTEKLMVAATVFNPIDLARITILLKMDVAALLGYSGAIFKDFFGTVTGQFLALGTLLLWIFLPAYWSLKKFNLKDL